MTRPDRPLRLEPAERDRARFVRVRGARENNLQDIDVEIPRDALVVFTGISGSGKSSLAFGTLYAEAQRRYPSAARAASDAPASIRSRSAGSRRRYP
jgi:excinuclease UvrABC ATPase subunit